MGDEGIHVCDVNGLSRDDSENEANASRIVACVNACDGVDQAVLEGPAAPGLLKRMLANDGRCVTAQRDTLLAALEALLEHEGTTESTGIGDYPSDALVIARKQAHSVIAEVKNDLHD